MLEWFLLTSYSVPLTSVITIATLVLTTVIVFRLFSKRQVNDFGNKFVVIRAATLGSVTKKLFSWIRWEFMCWRLV